MLHEARTEEVLDVRATFVEVFLVVKEVFDVYVSHIFVFLKKFCKISRGNKIYLGEQAKLFISDKKKQGNFKETL